MDVIIIVTWRSPRYETRERKCIHNVFKKKKVQVSYMMLQTLLVAYLITLSASSLQMETLSFGAAMCPVKNTFPDVLPCARMTWEQSQLSATS